MTSFLSSLIETKVERTYLMCYFQELPLGTAVHSGFIVTDSDLEGPNSDVELSIDLNNAQQPHAVWIAPELN